MKRILSYLIFSSLVFSCTSNDDFLKEDPKGQMFPEVFYNNADELELGLTAMYSKTNNICYKDHDGGILVALMGSDDITTTSVTMQEVDIYQTSSGNAFLDKFWETSYAAIKAANSLILNYERAVEATEQQRNYTAGQAYFVRAWCYFNLVRVFNQIPLIIDLDVHWDIYKSPAQSIYDLIVSDLKQAENMLPPDWREAKIKTLNLAEVAPSQGAAKSLLASVYLTMAGYPLLQADKYALAAEKAKEVIDNESKYGYKLLDNYDDLWKAFPQKNDELVWGQFFEDGDSQRAPYAGMPKAYGGWDLYMAEIEFFNNFPEGPRKDATFMTTFPHEDGTILEWSEMPLKHPYYKKMWETDKYEWDKPWVSYGWKSSRANQIIRYAEVLLIYAEAQAMADGTPGSFAYTCVNHVRERAGLDDLPTGLSGTAFRDAVVAERGWEFAGPEFAARWFDIIRLEKVEEIAANRGPDEVKLTKLPTKENYFAPIPESDILRNPNLGKDI